MFGAEWVRPLAEVLRALGSERAWVLLGTESLQTFGGSGFLQDYPIEQYIRDAKIDSLYEGTTAIQAQDFFFRKILRDRGAALGHVAELRRERAVAVEHERAAVVPAELRVVVGHRLVCRRRSSARSRACRSWCTSRG